MTNVELLERLIELARDARRRALARVREAALDDPLTIVGDKRTNAVLDAQRTVDLLQAALFDEKENPPG